MKYHNLKINFTFVLIIPTDIIPDDSIKSLPEDLDGTGVRTEAMLTIVGVITEESDILVFIHKDFT